MSRPLRTRIKRAWEELLGMAGGASYKGAETTRLNADWNPMLLTPDEETRWAARKLRARGRELARNNAYARQYLSLLISNVLGPRGITFQGDVRNNDGQPAVRVNETIELARDEWSAVATLDGRLSRVQFEQQTLRGVARDGEALVRLWRGGPRDFPGNRFGFALEAIDPTQLDEQFNRAAGEGSNEIRMGVEMDGRGRPAAYHVFDRPITTFGGSRGRDRVRIPADEIIHLYDPDRCNQTRGVTWFAPVMAAMRMLDGYTEAELVAARTSAAKMGWFTREGDDADVSLDENNSKSIEMEANPGTFEFAPQGYKLETWDPNHPNTAFGDFVKATLRQIATGLAIDYNTLANDLENVNYSSIRSGLLASRDQWRVRQQWWIASFENRLHVEWLNMALLNGALKLDSRDPRRFAAARWTPRGWPAVDPLKDMQRDVLGISSGLASRTQVLAEQGLDLEDVLEDLADEQDLAEQYGIDISIDKGAAVKNAAKTTQAEEKEPAADGEPGAADAGGNGAAAGARGRTAVLEALGAARPARLRRTTSSGPGRNGHGPGH